MPDFVEYISQERERLGAARQKLLEEKSALDAKIAEIDTEMQAISAYERAKTGRLPPKRSGRRGGIRADVLTVVQQYPGGVKRAEILDKMNAKGDKTKETSVSNALAALKKQGHIVSDSDGYKAVA